MTDTFHPGSGTRPRAAVIGGGVSGLTAAYVLQGTHEVTLFEADERVGGHAHTHDVTLSDGSTAAVDSGFIVLNDRTYPLLRRLLGELGVQTRPTEMSMSISCSGCGLTFVGGRGAGGIFAQRRRILDPRFWRLLLSVRRFQKAALALLSEEPASEISYGQFLDQRGFDAHFVTHYALPVVSCVWSMGDQEALDYPAAHLFAFLRHHGFLVLGDAPTWHTVVGGSRSYVRRITDSLDVVLAGTRVTAVSRKPEAVVLDDTHGEHHEFDKVVIATHADEALALLTDADDREQELLGAFGYSVNVASLHRDVSALPALARGRASWNYRLEGCGSATERARVPGAQVSYWMNRLQGHPEADPLVVTLNPRAGEEPSGTIATMTYQHPTFTAASVAAQRQLASLNTDRLSFAGSYHGWGFHEDGCRAGVAAAEALGATW